MSTGGLYIKGLAELMAKYGAAGPLISDTLYKASDRAVKYVHSTVPPYPMIPAGSKYQRTAMLGRATTTKVKPLGGGGFVGVIGNNMKYAPWVISTEKVGSRGPQTQVHKNHGWWTLQQVVSAATDAVYQIFHEAVITILEKL